MQHAEKGQTNTVIHYVFSSHVRHSSLWVCVVKTRDGLQRKQTPQIISAQSKAKMGEMWQGWSDRDPKIIRQKQREKKETH